ncbi:hypothetical protein QL285_029350 [Trifolium repens]|nr:hypothetical protein QL285_029350 [Trifolium repens]
MYNLLPHLFQTRLQSSIELLILHLTVGFYGSNLFSPKETSIYSVHTHVAYKGKLQTRHLSRIAQSLNKTFHIEIQVTYIFYKFKTKNQIKTTKDEYCIMTIPNSLIVRMHQILSRNE